MKKLLTFLLFSILILNASAQTLNIDFVEKCFTLSKKGLLDSLKKEGFKNLSDEEIYKEEILESDENTPDDIKSKIYSPKGVRKLYELRQKIGGGMCKVTLIMKSPEYNKVHSIVWNSNLTYSGGAYANQLRHCNIN